MTDENRNDSVDEALDDKTQGVNGEGAVAASSSPQAPETGGEAPADEERTTDDQPTDTADGQREDDEDRA